MGIPPPSPICFSKQSFICNYFWYRNTNIMKFYLNNTISRYDALNNSLVKKKFAIIFDLAATKRSTCVYHPFQFVSFNCCPLLKIFIHLQLVFFRRLQQLLNGLLTKATARLNFSRNSQKEKELMKKETEARLNFLKKETVNVCIYLYFK